MSLLLLVVSALHILILILLFVATLDKVSLLGTAPGPPAFLQFSEVAGIVVSISDTPSLSWQVPLAPPLSPNIYTIELCLSCLHPALCPGPPPLSYQIQAFPAPHPFPNPSHGLPDPTHFPFLTLSLFLCPSQSWWTLPGKESLNLWYDCTWNNDNKTWACSTVSENGKGHQGLV